MAAWQIVAELLWVLAGLVALLSLTGWFSQRIGLPSALGYLMVGVALPEAVTDAQLQEIVYLDEVAHVAVLLLLFFIGMELDLRTLRKVLHETRVVSLFNIIVPAAAVTILAQLWGWDLRSALVLGIALSLSSTIFGERLSAGKDFPASARTRMFGVLLAEDVAAGALLATLAILAGGSQDGGLLEPVTAVGVLVVALVVLAAVALLLVPRMLDQVARMHSLELLILTSGAFLLLFSAAGGWAGSSELGAFLAGMAAAEAGSRFVIRNALVGIRSVALALFFFASGLVVDPLVALSQWPLVLLCIVLVVASKLVVHVPSTMGTGLGLRDSLRVGFGMSTVGEFSLILVASAHANGIAHPALSAAVTGTIVGLLVVAPLLMAGSSKIAVGIGRLPRPVTTPLYALVQGLRRRREASAKPATQTKGRIRSVAALILVGVTFAAAIAANAWLPSHFPRIREVYLSSLVFGVALAIAAPLAYQVFRGYRALLRDLLGMPANPRGPDRLKMRIADAVIFAVVVLGFLVVGLALGASWPLLAGSLALAVIAGLVAWRQLTRLTATLESSLARVLGSEMDLPPTLLDQALQNYGWDFRVLAIGLPHESSLVGKTVGKGRLRDLTGSTVAVIKRGSREIVNPGKDEVFRGGDTLVLVGDPSQLAKAEALLEAGAEPLRMAAESRTASVADIEVQAGSWLEAHPDNHAELEDQSGAIIVGHVREGSDHPQPWRPKTPAVPGDRLIAMGTAFQIERLKSLLHAPPVVEEQAES